LLLTVSKSNDNALLEFSLVKKDREIVTVWNFHDGQTSDFYGAILCVLLAYSEYMPSDIELIVSDTKWSKPKIFVCPIKYVDCLEGSYL
jgi:hypothetical protein